MIRRIPQNGYWDGVASGLYDGNFRKTFSVDLDRVEGGISISPKMIRIEDSGTLTDLSGDSNRVIAFIRTDADCTDRYWALSPTALFRTDSAAFPDPNDGWDTDATASSPSTGLQDFTVHGNDSRNDSGRNKLVVSLDSDVAILNDTGNNAWTASWWVTKHSQPALDTNQPHPVEYFSNRKITLLGDGNKIHTISRPSDTQNDTVTNSRLILPRNLVVNSIWCTAERAWIGCFNKRQERGAIIEWDGNSQTFNRIHEINGIGVVAGVNYAGIPIALENTGKFLEYTGAGFTPMVRNGRTISLISPEDVGAGLTNGSSINAIGPSSVHWRGMVSGEDGLVYVNLAGRFNGGYGAAWERMTGIWCLNPTTGRLYNKYPLSGANGNDYGQQSSPVFTGQRSGGLYWNSNDALLFGRNLLAGGVMYTSATAAEGGIWLMEDYANGFGLNQGYLVTQYIHASDIEDTWDTIWLRLRQRFQGSQQVVLKARGVQHMNYHTALEEPIDKTITWTSTTIFTVTMGASEPQIQSGDEVEVLFGNSSGHISHVTAISGAHGALQTITVDDAGPSASGTAVARFERWKKLGVFTDSTKSTQKFNVGIDSSFIQLKILIRSNSSFGNSRLGVVKDLVYTSKPAINPEN